MTGAAIVAEGLGKRFGPVVALDGVDLEHPAGGVLGVLGPNGAGKTTVVRILATLLKPDWGRARVAGFDVAQHPAAVRRLIGLSGQYAAVDPFLTGEENLVMIGRLYGLTRGQVRVPTLPGVRHRPAGAVRAAVHLRFRRRHPRSRYRPLRRLPAAGHHRAGDRVRRLPDRRGHRRRPHDRDERPVRSLPITAAAVLAGRVAAALAAVALAVATGVAFSWLNLLLGLAVRDPESAGLAGLFPVITLFFTSSALVPVTTMPGWLQAFAKANPITVITGALRVLCLGGPATRPALEAAAWLLGLLAATIPAAIARYRHATST